MSQTVLKRFERSGEKCCDIKDLCNALVACDEQTCSAIANEHEVIGLRWNCDRLILVAGLNASDIALGYCNVTFWYWINCRLDGSKLSKVVFCNDDDDMRIDFNE
jgi:hypothetical protein